MTNNATMIHSRLWRGLRWGMWGGLAALLALPLVAMQFTDEVQWTLSDFMVMGGMLGMVGVAFELVVRVARGSAYVLAAGMAIATAFLMTWINLAVGIIGGEANPANLVFAGVLAVGLVGALIGRFTAGGMARAMVATGIAQLLAGGYALVLGSMEGGMLSAAFAVMWFTSAALFHKAAR